jgi:predicted nucleotidyltransferase
MKSIPHLDSSILTKESLEHIVDEIVGAVHPVKIILFGSYARGNATSQSDLDLLIIQEAPFIPRGNRIGELGFLWRLLSAVRVAKDLLLYTPDEVERWKSSLNHVIATALNEGIVLYER